MTIAACYLSSEGVVFGADSTSTMFVQAPGQPGGSDHHYNFAQKVFEIGEDGTLGMALWGLGSLGKTSHRTLIARLADQLTGQPNLAVSEIAERWNQLFWEAYRTEFQPAIDRTQELLAKAVRTPDEEGQLEFFLQNFSGGFCLAGHSICDRQPKAFEITFGPHLTVPAAPQELEIGKAKFWGCPNMIHRLIYGADFQLLEDIERSGKWQGTSDDLIALVVPHMLAQPFDLPIREAIDWVYTSIYTTSQAMKFSHLAPVCGGPVEIAVITTDRPFRWVRHKSLEAAITQGG